MARRKQPPQVAFGTEKDIRQIETDLLKIQGRTLVFRNTVYQIRNIAAFEVIDLSTEKPLPVSVAVTGGLAVLMTLFGISEGSGGALTLGILLLIGFAVLLSNHQNNKNLAAFGLRIVSNAGYLASTVLVSDDHDFLQRVALTLYNIINDESIQSVTISFDQRQTIEMNNVSGTTVVTGEVKGDLVNNV